MGWRPDFLVWGWTVLKGTFCASSAPTTGFASAASAPAHADDDAKVGRTFCGVLMGNSFERTGRMRVIGTDNAKLREAGDADELPLSQAPSGKDSKPKSPIDAAKTDFHIYPINKCLPEKLASSLVDVAPISGFLGWSSGR
jgi:hypothetical protein